MNLDSKQADDTIYLTTIGTRVRVIKTQRPECPIIGIEIMRVSDGHRFYVKSKTLRRAKTQ